MEKSHRIAQILGVPTAYLYCEDDDLAEVILAWSTLARGGRAQEKKAVLGLVARRQGERLGSRYDGMSAGWGGKRLLAAYRYRQEKLLLSDDGNRWWIQPVNATHSSNISAGVLNPSVFLGRWFNCLAIASKLSCE